jgi:hypothetical protein
LPALRLLSTFFAVKALVLWLTDPFPDIPLIVLSNRFIPPAYQSFCANGAGFVTFPESNAKALLTLRIKSACALPGAGLFRQAFHY